MKTKLKNGKTEVYVRHCGREYRRRFGTEAEADKWLDDLKAGIGEDAELAGVSPEVAMRDYLDRKRTAANRRKAGAMTLADLLEAFLAQRRDIAAPTRAAYRSYGGRLGKWLKTQRIGVDQIDRLQVRSFMLSLPDSSHNASIAYLSALFRWAVSEGYMEANPAEKARRLKLPEPPKGILTASQMAALLDNAARVLPRLVPLIALGGFAGVRPYEAMRLRQADIRTGFVILAGAITKTADARTVEIRPNLRAWLDSFPLSEEAMTYDQYIKTLARCRAPAEEGGKAIPWPHDCLRHSFATYAYEMTKDSAAVAAELGHGGTRNFFKHYRALVHPGDGARWFSIMPKKTGGD